ncbi:MAG: FG-GAP repeat protein, partial [Planctomycetota bacterium]|nr:FG-GAP repeat protein [Planctomycetota bacterium]
MRRFMPLLAAAVIVLSTAAAQADLGDQLFKLLPDDGAAFDEFGASVAISGTTAVAGAPKDDDNGTWSGSAYLFDITTGTEIAKLLPNDGAQYVVFGHKVAISGTTAIIGAYADDDKGIETGSAYLFDTTTGQQIAKLLPDGGAEDDYFGGSLSISGTTVIVGAHGDDDNGSSSGSAYIFDTTTGQQSAKLLPDDGAEHDLFGISVAISGATAIVGASWDDDNGTESGSAYLFDTTTGRQITKLLPNDGAEYDRFGTSVAICGSTAIIGAHRDTDNGTDS